MPVDVAASIGSWFHDTALDGSLALAIPIALIAGAFSFFSPCVIPLLPGYLSYITGLSGADLVARGSSGMRGRLLLGTALFILGFSVVFIAYGAVFGELGYQLVSHQHVITRVLGALTIVTGLVFAGLVPWLQRDVRFHRVPAVGLMAAPLIGALFGFGWTPCIGPTLAAVLSLSAASASAGRGALLTLVYCLGLGIPFLVAAVAFRRMLGAVAFVRRHNVWVMRIGGAMLVGLGILLLTGGWESLVAWTQSKVVGYVPAV